MKSSSSYLISPDPNHLVAVSCNVILVLAYMVLGKGVMGGLLENKTDCLGTQVW